MAQFDFSSRDYDTIKSDLLARAARVLPEWTDRDPSDFGMLFIDLWAYTADVMHYYIDRVAGEAFLPTATQRESVLALANLLDYVPRGRASAEGQMTVSNSGTTPYTIAADTQFIARAGGATYQCYTPQGGTAASASLLTLSVREGLRVLDEVLTASASGDVGQRYTLAQPHVAANSVVVHVYENGTDPTTYSQVARITEADTGDRVFSINVTPTSAIEIVFGTSVNGFIPPPGSKITVNYTSSSGANGNLPANSVIGWKASTPPNMSVVSSTAFVGGTDEESIASLKLSIPSVISAQNRAVTRNDFISLATQVPSVAKATISFTPGASGQNASVTVYPQVARGDYLTTTDTFQTISASMKSDVVGFLQPRALLGVTVKAADTVQWTSIDIQATVFVNERAVSNWVLRDVKTAIDELFAFDNVFFGQRLTLGQLYRIILNVPGVDYCNVTVFDVSGSAGLQPSILIDPLKLPKKGVVTLTMNGGITTSG